MAHELALLGDPASVTLLERGAETLVEIDGRRRAADLRPLGGGAYLLTLDGAAYRVWLARDGGRMFVHADGVPWTVDIPDAGRGAQTAGGAAADSALAPMPGTVISVAAAAGTKVAAGDTLLVIESMKLETTIKAWRAGAVAEVHVAEGGTFDKGAPLVTLAPEELDRESG